MDVRERHFGPIATPGDDDQETSVDVDALIRRLLLFEHCYLESIRLLEIPELVRVFGYSGVVRLLEDPNFQIIGDVLTAGSVGQTAGLRLTERRGYALPSGSYHITPVGLPLQEFFRFSRGNLQQIAGLRVEQRQNLERTLERKLMRYPVTAAASALEDFAKDVEGGGTRILPAFQDAIRQNLGIDVGDKLRVDVERLPFEGDYRVRTNLIADFGVDEQAAHKAVERALLGIAALNQRVRLMEALNAVTGFRDAEAPVFDAKLRFIVAQVNPNAQEDRFERVARLGGLPSLAALGPGAKVDMNVLLRLRSHPDCVDLRRWLRSTDGQSDDAIRQQFESVKEKLAGLTHSPAGSAVRFVVTQGIGLIPVVGAALGVAGSLADKFIFDKLIGSPGPIYFLGRRYHSIFKQENITGQ